MDALGDLDLDLDPIITKNNRFPAFTCTYLYVNYLIDRLKTMACRAQTDRQKDRQTNRLTDILSKTLVFESNEITQRATAFENFIQFSNVSVA